MCHAALEQLFDLPPADRNLPVLQNLFRREWAAHRLSDAYRFLFETETVDDEDNTNENNNNNNNNNTDNDNNNETNNEDAGSSSSSSSPEQQQQQQHRDLEAEAEWGRSALHLLENYMQVEDPATVPRPNPVQREVWVKADLTVQTEAGVTGYTTTTTTSIDDDDNYYNDDDDDNNNDDKYNTMSTNTNTTDSNDHDTFLVRGIVDRLDMVRVVDNPNNNNNNKDERIVLRLIDYKTGKAPHLKYSRAMNEQIQSEAFYQLMIYALLLREQHDNKSGSGLPLRYLRLFYLTSVDDHAVTMDMDLGDTQTKRDEVLQAVHQDLSAVWQQILELVSQQDPKAFVGCDRSFCYCHKCRARFVPGTVWEPPQQEGVYERTE